VIFIQFISAAARRPRRPWPDSAMAGIQPLAKLEAKYEDRKSEREKLRQERAQNCNPTENANVFWQVYCLSENLREQA
jgi:hypothetical protein